jgi:hypothetical protein
VRFPRHSINRWTRLHIVKQLLNAGVRILNRVLPERRAQFPQTELLDQAYRKLLQAYRIEAWCGRFDNIPYETLKTLGDRNFLNVLELSRKLLVYLADTDRYYRQWLGLFFLLVHDAVEEQQRTMRFEQFLKSEREQWELPMEGAFPREYFNAHKRDFQQILLTNHLYNLCATRYENLVPRETE